MRIITRKYQVFNFNELSDEAKEKVREWYLNGQDSWTFTQLLKDDLEILFPNSDLNVEYSLGYCQGDGLNIYGELRLEDVLDKVKEHFTEKELRFFAWAFNNYTDTIKMVRNGHYCYCVADMNDFSEDIYNDMDNDYCSNIPVETLDKFNKLAQEYFVNLCKQYEKEGYAYFYEVDDETLEEWCDCNEYEFTEDGELFSE